MPESDSKEIAQKSLDFATQWLLKREGRNGWESEVRVTCYALQAIVSAGISTLDPKVTRGCSFLCSNQNAGDGTWNNNDGDTAEVLRTLVICGKPLKDRAIISGLKGLNSLKMTKKFIVRSDVGWVHPNLIARALVAVKQDATSLLDPISAFLTGEVGFDVKFTSRAVLVFSEAKVKHNGLKKAEEYLNESTNGLFSLSGEAIGYLLQALVALGYNLSDGIIQKIINYLCEKQKNNGSWDNNIRNTAQIVLGLSVLGLRYKKPSIMKRKNILRVSAIGALFAIAIIVDSSIYSTQVNQIVNIVGFAVTLILVVEWAYPKIKDRV
jgi:hypothetical protein